MCTQKYICSWITGIIAALFLTIPSGAFSQDLNKRITIIAHEVPLEKIIKEIEGKGGVYFSYSPQAIPVHLPVSIEARDKSIGQVLKKMFRKTGISYKLVGDHIVLTAAGDDLPTGDTLLYDKSHFTLSGYLRDQRSGEVLIGAHVYDEDTYEGTTTNAYGFFSLTLPAGYHRIKFSFLGYEEKAMKILFDRDQVISPEMKETLLTMKEVEIIGRSENPYFLNTQISEFRFNSNTLSQIPGITGDKDII
ncbi:MAG TPA: carboxypeptidase-like regulatory domain-containing protein, partial [Bacteroidales bacterium]|nr:carboxypeptidase-like regulatory domain-containing protein [Bacteroidales bacterium]